MKRSIDILLVAAVVLMAAACSHSSSSENYSETISLADFPEDYADMAQSEALAEATPAQPGHDSTAQSNEPEKTSEKAGSNQDSAAAEKNGTEIADSVAAAPAQPEVLRLNSGRIKTKNLGRLAEVFNDSNYLQLQHAERLGIHPISGTLSSFYNTTRPLVKIENNPDFAVEELTHSYPFLVPEAATLLHEIGANFSKELENRGGGKYKIIVTSALRTPDTVKRLKRVNRNAVEQSTHQYGTTFDITYNRFSTSDGRETVASEDFKLLLAEVIEQLRAQGRCLVKYEIKSPCFHITVTR